MGAIDEFMEINSKNLCVVMTQDSHMAFSWMLENSIQINNSSVYEFLFGLILRLLGSYDWLVTCY